MTTQENQEPTMFLTVEEVAHQLRCTPRHVRNLMARGELPKVRVGRAVRVPRAALEQLAQGKTAEERQS